MTTTDQPSRTGSALFRPLRWHALAPVLIGLCAAAIVSVGGGVPSLWGDEAASVMSAQRSWGSLWEMIGNVDAVHALYYATLHLWIDAFGSSPFAVRLPSALAVGAAVTGVLVLCRRFTTTTIAVTAAVVCVLIPRVAFMGIEARSAAFAAAFVTWLTVLLVRLVRTAAPVRAAWWSLYAAVLVVSVHFFLYTVLIGVVHAAILIVLRARREVAWGWGIATASAAILCAPFAMVAASQRGQISFLARRDVTSPSKILVEQWFGSFGFAAASWAAIIIAIAWAAWSHRRHRDQPGDADRRALVWIGALWLLIPTMALLIANAVAGPLYTGRYLSFCAPAAAILIAVALSTFRHRAVRIVAAVAVLVLALPIAAEQRAPHGKFGSDWAQVSTYIGEHSEDGDGIVFDESVRPSRKPRLSLRLYPEGFQRTSDLGLVNSFEGTTGLWDEVKPLDELPGVLDEHRRVWVVARSENGTRGDERTLQASGYRLTDTHRLSRDVVLLYTKGPS